MCGKEPVSARGTLTVAANSTKALSRLSDFWALTKPEVNFLILITTFTGFYLGCIDARRPLTFSASFNVLLGTLLVASGTATLNQYIERNFDAQMRRTARRPAATGRIAPNRVLVFGCVLSLAGSIYLWVASDLLANLLALITLLSYLFLYTPLKRRTSLCVLVGAFPGAMPPLIGWAAAAGNLTSGAWLLYAIVFLWQFPHFMAIAWMYREDYDRAGYFMLPSGNVRALALSLQTTLPLALLIPISLYGRTALIFGWTGFVLTLGFGFFGVKFLLDRSRQSARHLLAASIIHLPLLLALRVALV